MTDSNSQLVNLQGSGVGRCLSLPFYIPHSQNSAVYGRIIAVVKLPCSYYDFTTFRVPGLPNVFLSCNKFNNLRAKMIVGRLRRIRTIGLMGYYGFTTVERL